MRGVLLLAVALAACGPAPPPPQPVVKKDAVEEDWYGPTVTELTQLDREAETAFKKGNQDVAAALIEKGKALEQKLLSAREPTLEAMEAASDLDQLYGQMLLTNHNCGWATQFFQKNVARWKHWPTPNDDTASRLKLAQTGIAECERRMMQ